MRDRTPSRAYDVEMTSYLCHNLVLATSLLLLGTDIKRVPMTSLSPNVYILLPKSMENLYDLMLPCALHIYYIFYKMGRFLSFHYSMYAIAIYINMKSR